MTIPFVDGENVVCPVCGATTADLCDYCGGCECHCECEPEVIDNAQEIEIDDEVDAQDEDSDDDEVDGDDEDKG